jgi:transposase
MKNHQATLQEQDSAKSPVLYMAIEMGEKNWKLLFSSGEPKRNGQLRTYQRTIEGNDWEALEEMIKLSKKRLKLIGDAPVVSCYEAGQDGFYPHRQMLSRGIDNRVVDSASIEVNRRARRAKSDGLDVRKLMEMLVREGRGEVGVWRVVNVPTEEEEDRRRTHRELERLKKEDKQHRTRIRSLLKLEGIRPEVAPGGRGWARYLEDLKSRVRPRAWTEIERESRRLELVKEQIRKLEALRREALEAAPDDPLMRMILGLILLRGIGECSAWLLVMEFFGWRKFKNRRQVAGCAGMDPTPYDSGESVREQGISKAGNKRVRWLMVELAWSWLRYQPGSRLSQWFQRRFGKGGKRQRRIGIVALARRLLVDLWRYVDAGVIPQGAVLAPSPTQACTA